MHFGGNLASQASGEGHVACEAGLAPNCQEAHLLSHPKTFRYGKMAFWGQGCGTPPPLNQPLRGGRDLDGVPRDTDVRMDLREASGPDSQSLPT